MEIECHVLPLMLSHSLDNYCTLTKFGIMYFYFQVMANLTENITDINVDKLKKIASEVCDINEEEFDGMLSYYHNLGVIILHGDLVVLKRQWVAEQFAKLFVIPKEDDQVLFVKNSRSSCWISSYCFGNTIHFLGWALSPRIWIILCYFCGFMQFWNLRNDSLRVLRIATPFVLHNYSLAATACFLLMYMKFQTFFF